MQQSSCHDSLWLRKQRDYRTAIHEAGHATVAVLEGRVFKDVLLEKQDNSNGQVRHLKYCSYDDDIVRILLAGIMATRLSRCRWDSYLFHIARDDMGSISNFLREKPKRLNMLKWSIGRTEQLLKSSWNKVEWIASELIKRRRMTFLQCKDVIAHDRDLLPPVQPFGKLGKMGWKPVVECIEFRFDYPNGLEDLLAEARRA